MSARSGARPDQWANRVLHRERFESTAEGGDEDADEHEHAGPDDARAHDDHDDHGPGPRRVDHPDDDAQSGWLVDNDDGQRRPGYGTRGNGPLLRREPRVA